MLDRVEIAFEAQAHKIYEKRGYQCYAEFDSDYKIHVEIWKDDVVVYTAVFAEIPALFKFMDSVEANGLKAINAVLQEGA